MIRLFSPGESLGDVKIIRPDPVISVQDVKLGKDADRGIGIVRPDAVQLPAPAVPYKFRQIMRGCFDKLKIGVAHEFNFQQRFVAGYDGSDEGRLS